MRSVLAVGPLGKMHVAATRLRNVKTEPQIFAFAAAVSKWNDSKWNDLLPLELRTQGGARVPDRSLPCQGECRLRCVKHFQRVGQFFVANFRDGKCGHMLSWEEDAVQPFVLPTTSSSEGCTVTRGMPIGLEDPRSILWRGRPWVVAHERHRVGSMKGMVLVELSTRKTVQLWLGEKGQRKTQYWARLACTHGKVPPVGQCVEKNWTPFVWRDRLRFVYSMSPLSVVELASAETGECKVVAGNLDYVRNDNGTTIAGGTPLLPLASFTTSIDGFSVDALVGFAHVIEKARGLVLYRTVAVLLDAERNELRVGPTVDFPWPKHPLARSREAKEVQYPYELEMVGVGRVRVGVEINDCFPTWFTMSTETFLSLLPAPSAQRIAAVPWQSGTQGQG